MDFTEKTVRKNPVFQGKILSVYNDEIELTTGEKGMREIVEQSGGAAVLCIKENKALFVRQYRYAYGEEVIEIPAGKLEKGENPMNAAKRELQEEGGICAEELKLLCTLYPSPGYTNEKIYIYLAENGKSVGQSLDDGEFLTAEWMDISKAEEMLKSGIIKDAKTVVALQSYLLNQK